jgi:hypothetical protein
LAKTLRRPPPPSRAFTDLKGKTLKELTPDDYDSLISETYLEKENHDLINDISLIAGSKQSPSGPMAGGSKIVSQAYTDTGDVNVYQPDAGQVWILQDVSIVVVSSGSSTVQLGMNGTMAVSKSLTLSGGGSIIQDDLKFPKSTFYMDENTYLTLSKTGSFSEIAIHLLLLRVR